MFQVLLLLRINAIYEGDKKVLLTLLLVYVISYGTTLITATIGVIQLLRESLPLCSSASSYRPAGSPASVKYSQIVKACIPTEIPRIMAAIWGAPVRARSNIY
jgi:hypothetical protein